MKALKNWFSRRGALPLTAYLLAAPACTLLVVSGLFGLLAMAFMGFSGIV